MIIILQDWSRGFWEVVYEISVVRAWRRKCRMYSQVSAAGFKTTFSPSLAAARPGSMFSCDLTFPLAPFNLSGFILCTYTCCASYRASPNPMVTLAISHGNMRNLTYCSPGPRTYIIQPVHGPVSVMPDF